MSRRVRAHARHAAVLVLMALLPAASDAQSLPAGWAASSIGSPLVPGAASHSAGTFTISGAGVNALGTADQLLFVHRQLTGDALIVARLGTFSPTLALSKTGVMIRESLTAGSRHAYLSLSGSGGLAFERRTSGGGSTTSVAAGNAAAPVWLRLQRRGSALTASRSADGQSWTVIATETVAFAQTIYVGMAIASGTLLTSATAAYSSVDVSSGQQPPSVSLTQPMDGASYTAPATITLSASASDADDGVARVEFFANSTLVGSDTTSPFSVSWSNVSSGSYSVSAVAYDRSGLSATSSARTVTVTAAPPPPPPNSPPTISLTSPSNGQTYVAPAAVDIAASAADADGTVTRVDFYVNAVLLSSDSSAPYQATARDLPAGNYALVASATDDNGATTVSSTRTVTVTERPMPRTAIFNPSSNHADAVDRYLLEIYAAGSNPEAATPFATHDLGKPAVVDGECRVDVGSTITGLPPGNYIGTVTAIGAGGTARSASASFTR